MAVLFRSGFSYLGVFDGPTLLNCYFLWPLLMIDDVGYHWFYNWISSQLCLWSGDYWVCFEPFGSVSFFPMLVDLHISVLHVLVLMDRIHFSFCFWCSCEPLPDGRFFLEVKHIIQSSLYPPHTLVYKSIGSFASFVY